MDPNSQNQLWAEWEFTIREAGRHVPRKDVEYNAAKWLRMGFGSVGVARVSRTIYGWRIQLRAEGRPAHDKTFEAEVRKQFQNNFVAKGWGPLATGDVKVRILAGSEQNGKPAKQWVGLPVVEIL